MEPERTQIENLPMNKIFQTLGMPTNVSMGNLCKSVAKFANKSRSQENFSHFEDQKNMFFRIFLRPAKLCIMCQIGLSQLQYRHDPTGVNHDCKLQWWKRRTLTYPLRLLIW
jgi:hypothetical protein